MSDETPTITPRLRNPLAETLAAGRLGLAMIVQKAMTVDIALAAQACGFDAISVDLEHSVIPESVAAQICVTAMNTGVTPLVRIAGHDAAAANRLLDCGALGIIVPHIESAAQARALVSAARFAPQGTRSATYLWPHLGYRPHEAVAARQALNAATMVIVMLETPEAVEHAGEIAAVPGVDILHVGSVDLCEALGIPGRVDDPRVEDCFAKVIAACRKHGKVAGAGGVAGSPQVVRRIVAMGARFVTAGIDWDFMLAGARQRVGQLRELPT